MFRKASKAMGYPFFSFQWKWRGGGLRAHLEHSLTLEIL